jgi:hypothetical protein
MKRREAAYPVIHYNYTPCRKDWLFVGKEALVSVSDGAASARDPNRPIGTWPIRGSSW